MDIVYILGTGSIWDNTELRYSLRSVEKHLKGVGNIFIVGESVKFLKDVTFIKAGDNSHCKEENIKNKIVIACRDERVSDDFLFINDDHFLLQDYNINEIPYFYGVELNEKLTNFKKMDKYAWAVKNTLNALMKKGYPIHYFDVHTPIIYNKDKFLLAMNKYDWLTFPYYDYGYVVKSLYCNTNNIEAKPENKIEDLKIKQSRTMDELKKDIDGQFCFSIGDMAINPDLFKLLKQLYPNSSKWEL